MAPPYTWLPKYLAPRKIFAQISASTQQHRFSPKFRPSHGGADFPKFRPSNGGADFANISAAIFFFETVTVEQGFLTEKFVC